MIGLICLGYGVPSINIRGLVGQGGSKSPEVQANVQTDARAVFRLAVKLAELLGRQC
jgi:hypothetical protein